MYIDWRRLGSRRKRLVSLQIVEFHVNMDCPGCERAVRNALKMKGVESVEIDMDQQKVTVTGYVERKKLLHALRTRSGRKAEFWTFPYEPGTYYPLSLRNDYHNYNYSSYSGGIFRENTYNYRKHGYTSSDKQGFAYTRPDDSAFASFFSDDNPHACSIM